MNSVRNSFHIYPDNYNLNTFLTEIRMANSYGPMRDDPCVNPHTSNQIVINIAGPHIGAPLQSIYTFCIKGYIKKNNISVA